MKMNFRLKGAPFTCSAELACVSSTNIMIVIWRVRLGRDVKRKHEL